MVAVIFWFLCILKVASSCTSNPDCDDGDVFTRDNCISTQCSFTNCHTRPSHLIGDRRFDHNKLSIATLNAEWLFEPKKLPNEINPVLTQDESDKHVEEIARVLRNLNADIVNLVEVQHCSILQKLSETLADMRYVPYVTSGLDTATGQNAALLTRIDPITDIQFSTTRMAYPVSGTQCSSICPSCTMPSGGTRGASKHYFTTFRVNNEIIHLIGLHLYAMNWSKTQNFERCLKRDAEGQVIESIMSKEWKDTKEHMVVLGDFNDFDSATPDRSDNTAVSSAIATIRGNRLKNVAIKLPQEQRYTYSTQSLDHILVSDGLFDKLNDFTPSAGCERQYSGVVINRDGHDGASDHYPLMANFGFLDHAVLPSSSAMPSPSSSGVPHNSKSPDNLKIISIIIFAAVIPTVTVITVVSVVLVKKYQSRQETNDLITHSSVVV